MKTFSYSDKVKQQFDSIAPYYKEAAVISQAVNEQMLSRLSVLNAQPKTILDVGCANGDAIELLKKTFSDATVIGLDIASNLLSLSENDAAFICGNAAVLPIKSHSIDLIYSNLLLPWCEDIVVVLKEWRRVLKPGGLLLFSSYGPDTLKEIQTIPQFIDMHYLGDQLLALGFANIVMNVEHFSVDYDESSKINEDMRNQGMMCFLEDVKNVRVDLLELDYEVIFGQCEVSKPVSVPLSHVRRE